MTSPQFSAPLTQSDRSGALNCAQFCKRSHEEAVEHICHYLLRTKEQGLILHPDKAHSNALSIAHADWAGSWQNRSSNDPLSTHSRTGFVVMCAGCRIMWGSKMQSLIVLNTTEAEYIPLLQLYAK